MTSMLINIKLSAENQYDFKKIKNRLIQKILMVGFNAILDIDQVEYLQIIKDKLLDGKEL